jgi:dehydratase
MSQTVNVTRPATITRNQPFQMVITADAMNVPTTAGGYSLSSLTAVVIKFPIPAGTTVSSVSLSGGSNYGSGTPTATISGGNIVLSVPGQLTAGTLVVLPTVTATMTATGAVSPVNLYLAGNSYSNPGMTFTANLSLGGAATKCYANPNLALTTFAVL